MSNLKLPDVTDLESARRFLGGRQRSRLGYATTIGLAAGGDVVVTHHSTDIIRYLSDGGIWLRADGWVTSTTADRMHRLTPPHVRVGRRLGNYVVTIDEESYIWGGIGVFQIPA